ncbi:cellulase family glycosylhydrolase [Parachryseolinea silvisoli]|uniref:cellulase family glycosylhydrolase n=1 Tax=Parachryseolinea silvisoli TaxID=2873601 RepID=UPI0022659B77|nr:cellulase family glycosylhydrolase [Parachryseolinea silvisoli]MCD9015022.1 cellulase family glycosylhydrolase [Parachryseolinea silvisoli]
MMAMFLQKRVWVLLLLVLTSLAQANAQLSRLRADGTRIVNEAGQEVILKGVGLGGWLLQEGYMMNPEGGGTQGSFKKRLYDQGQSEAQVEAFYQAWRDNFITPADINWIADQGFNCVRLPMHYDLFLTPAQRTVRHNVIRNPGNYQTYVNSLTTWYNNNELFVDPNLEGFRTLENTLNWCAARGMYVIVDLHAAPGGQGKDANIADLLVENDLWNRAIFQNMTVRLWEKIVSRYINNNTVAFWDLINEPNAVPQNQMIHALKNRLVNSIRGLGDTHLIMIEGNGFGNNYDYLEPFTFTNRSNLVYNAHRYWIPPGDDNIRDGNPNQINRLINLVEFRTRHNVPVWVGETGEDSDEWLRQNVDKLNANGIGYAHWTYKRTSSGPNAALRRIVGPPYLTSGVSAMSGVLNNIKFANTVINNGPLAAVDPRRTPLSTVCSGAYTTVPATLQAEGFCAAQGIQVDVTTDTGGGQYVGWTEVGDWLGYRINVPAAGTYTIEYRVASLNGGGALRLERFGGSATYGTLSIPATGGWQTWQTLSHTVQLPAGQQELGLAITGAGFNLNWIRVVGDTNNPTPTAPIGQTIWLRGFNGQYVSGENGTQAMQCTRPVADAWENFTVEDAGNGKVALRSMSKYVSSENGVQAMTCSRLTISDWERFDWIVNADNTISLRGNNGLYVSSENGEQAMTCTRPTIQGWESFNWGVVGVARLAAAAHVPGEIQATEQELSVYPNPSVGQITLKVGKPSHVEIRSVADGSTVFSSEVKETTLVKNLPAGIYTVTLKEGNRTRVRRIVVAP